MTGLRFLLQSEADMQVGGAWLSEAEQARAASFPVEKRRRDWCLGRWAAKRILAALDGLSPDDAVLRRYSVIPLTTGAPVAFRDGASLGRAISISHSHGVALVLADADRGAALGCDLERIEPRASGFEEDYLTNEERRHLDGFPDRDLRTTLLWTGKESVMKALGEGLRLPAKAVEVAPRGDWPSAEGSLAPFAVRRPAGDLEGRWGVLRGLAAALVFPLGSEPPQALDLTLP